MKREYQKGQILWRRRREESGQILLIVVLTMIIALTVGLSIAARTVTELKISKQNEQSQSAFQAAEAGIEQTLKNKSDISQPIDLGNNASFTTTYNIDNGSVLVINNGQEVDQDSGADVWLSNYPDYSSAIGNGAPVTMTMYWGSSGQSCITIGDSVKPAIEIALLYGTVSSPSIRRYVYEAPTCTRIKGADTSATTGNFSIGGTNFVNSVQLPAITNGLIMKVIPLFNSSLIGFQIQSPTSVIFPSQGAIITSTGSSGDTVRKVQYYQSYPQLPLEVFPYSILSQ